MSKFKKVLLMCTAYVLVAALAIGGTIAYLQDTDSDVNVMTLGNVSIEQIEQERDTNGNLVDFTQAKPALPVVGTIAWDDQKVAVNGADYKVFDSDLKNVVDKIVTVKNTGKTDAYIRTIIAIEAPDYDPNDLIHINTNTDGVAQSSVLTEINGVKYYVLNCTYEAALEAGASSAPSLLQVFLDSKATNEDCAKFGDAWEILVLSQAIQSEGFADAKTALNAGFGEFTAANVQTWFGDIVIPTVVQDDITSDGTGYGYFAANGEVTIFDDADIVTSGGGVSVWGTAEFNGGSIVTNSTSTSGRHVFYVASDGGVQANGHLTINGGEFTFSPSNLTRKGYYICADGEGAMVIVNGGTFGKPSTRTNYKAGIAELNGGKVIIKGGTFGFDPSAWVADGYEAVQNGSVWTVSAK